MRENDVTDALLDSLRRLSPTAQRCFVHRALGVRPLPQETGPLEAHGRTRWLDTRATGSGVGVPEPPTVLIALVGDAELDGRQDPKSSVGSEVDAVLLWPGQLAVGLTGLTAENRAADRITRALEAADRPVPAGLSERGPTGIVGDVMTPRRLLTSVYQGINPDMLGGKARRPPDPRHGSLTPSSSGFPPRSWRTQRSSDLCPGALPRKRCGPAAGQPPLPTTRKRTLPLASFWMTSTGAWFWP